MNGRECSGTFVAGSTPIPSPVVRSIRRPGSWRKNSRKRAFRIVIAPTGRGLVAGPEGKHGTEILAFRADIDALRIHDVKTVAYRSTREGVMHACGHDAHATMALGAALALWQCRDQLPRGLMWRAIFQPSEEVGEGASEMIATGAMKHVAAVIALHVDPDTPVGHLAYRQGVLTAFCQELQVDIQGQGGHAARPHQSIDPIGVASQFITSVYQFVPRSVDSRDPVVVTFGSIQGGSSANVIPEHGAAEGNDPDAQRKCRTPRGGENPADRLRPVGGQWRTGSDSVPTRNRRRGQRSRRDAHLRAGRRRGGGPGESS